MDNRTFNQEYYPVTFKDIKCDPDRFQLRASLNREHIRTLAYEMDALLKSQPSSPIIKSTMKLAILKGVPYVIDGHHRHAAYCKLIERYPEKNLEEIEYNCYIITSNEKAARKAAIAQNADNTQLPRTNADKKKASLAAAEIVFNSIPKDSWELTIDPKQVHNIAQIWRSQTVKEARRPYEKLLAERVAERLYIKKQEGVAVNALHNETGIDRRKISSLIKQHEKLLEEVLIPQEVIEQKEKDKVVKKLSSQMTKNILKNIDDRADMEEHLKTALNGLLTSLESETGITKESLLKSLTEDLAA